jgi:hypothetical protein
VIARARDPTAWVTLFFHLCIRIAHAVGDHGATPEAQGVLCHRDPRSTGQGLKYSSFDSRDRRRAQHQSSHDLREYTEVDALTASVLASQYKKFLY